MRQPTTSKRNILGAENREKAVNLRIAGLGYKAIGDNLGISASGAWQAVKKVLDQSKKAADESAEQLIQIELIRLDEMQLAIWPKVKRGDEKAIDAALKIMQRRAKLLGLDAPDKLQVMDTPIIKIKWADDATGDRSISTDTSQSAEGDIPIS